MTLVRALAIAFFGVSIPSVLLAAPSQPTPAPAPPTPTPHPVQSNAEQVGALHRLAQPRVEKCAQLPSPPEHGTEKVTFSIGASGDVASVVVVSTSFNTGVTGCIAAVSRHIIFPPPPTTTNGVYKIDHVFTVLALVAVPGNPLPVMTDKYKAILDAIVIAPCKKPDGPTGPGKVKLEIDPTGKILSSTIVEPSTYASSAVGQCVRMKYHTAKFDPPTVGEYTYSFDLK
jgi:hypothetical protein